MPDTFPNKAPYCKHLVVRNQPLTLGGSTVISAPFPIGEGYSSILISIKNVFSVGTGTTARSEGMQRLVREIHLRTDRDGIIVKAPGRALFRRAQKLMGSAPFATTWAASNGTYYLDLPIHFENRRLRRPCDTILNTGRYKMVELTITLGALSDLLGTVGTAAATLTCDIIVEKTMYAVDESNAPIMVPYIIGLPAVDPNSLQYIDIEKNPTLGLLDVMMFTSNTNVVAGVPFSGDAADTVVDNITVFDNKMPTFRNVPFLLLQHDNMTKFDYGTTVPGWAVADFVEDGSLLSGLSTGDKSVLQLQWVNDTPTGGQCSALLDGVRGFQN